MNEQLVAWLVSTFGIIMFLIGYYVGRYTEYKEQKKNVRNK